jgi:multiple sugar transport system substrate-binding protein
VLVLLGFLVVPLVRGGDAEEDDPLVILSGRDDSVGEQRRLLVEEWNRVHPESTARIVELSPIADAQHSEMLARAQSEHPDVDVYNLDVTWTAEFAAGGYIQPLDESRVQTAEFFDGPLSTCRYDGRLWALPFNADLGLLYYRTDLLEQIGRPAPQDWDTLVDQAEAVRAISGDRPIAGYVGQTADYEGLTVTAWR